jgi:hypothetical protein
MGVALAADSKYAVGLATVQGHAKQPKNRGRLPAGRKPRQLYTGLGAVIKALLLAKAAA